MCRIGNNAPGVPAVAARSVVCGNIAADLGILVRGVAVVCCKWCIVDRSNGQGTVAVEQSLSVSQSW